jgi:hypothetical protein
MRLEQEGVTYEIRSLWKGGGSNTQQEWLQINLNKKPCAIKLRLTGIWDVNEQRKAISFILPGQALKFSCMLTKYGTSSTKENDCCG